MSINVKKINASYYEDNNAKVLYVKHSFSCHYILSREKYNHYRECSINHKYEYEDDDIYLDLEDFEQENFCLTIPNNEIDYNQVAFFNKFFGIKSSKVCYILFNDNLYEVSISQNESVYTLEELSLLIKEKIYKSNKKFEQIKKQIELYEKFEAKEKPEPREPIPEDVRFEVWRRDGGKCVICGSNKNLEFDHIIPFSKGGSSTARNIQLLCQECNRRKSDKI